MNLRLTILLSCLGLSCTLSAADRPNIVFIFSDDHATNAISAYNPDGNLNNTPNLDRIANEGMLFRNSFCANSICGPSRANILTGKHSHINGFLDNENSRFDGNQPTFPKMLQQAGYATAMIGKWHLVSNPTGFDKWEVLPGQGSYYNPDLIQMDGTKKRYQGYCTDIITDLALDWLKEERAEDKPFMLMCQHKAPHRNWSPAPRHYTLYDDRNLPEPDTLFDDYGGGRSKTLKEHKMGIAGHMYWGHDMKFHGESPWENYFLNGIPNGEYRRMNPTQKARWDSVYAPKNEKLIDGISSGKMNAKQVTRWKYQRYIKDYLRTIQAVDDGVGRILDYLDATGLAENTIVIYSSDQGFYLGEHGWYDKRWMYEESLEMPFMIRWPGTIKPGTKSDALIQNIDYAPTFLDLAGAEIPEEIQGKSIVPVLKGEGNSPDDWRDAIYYAYYGERTHNVAAHDGIRTQDRKLMYFPKTEEWNLYDLTVDPQEMRSLHDDPLYADTLVSLKSRYQEMRKHYGVNSAVIPEHRMEQGWWKKRWEQNNQQTQKGPAQIVFVGDSITQGWQGAGKATWDKYYAGREAINLGFSGDRTEHALWRLRKGRFRGAADAKLGVVMIGTNNTGHKKQDPTETAAGVREIVREMQVRMPKAKILLLGVFPRSEKPDDEMRKITVGINGQIKGLADGDKVHFLDIADTFLNDDGTLPKEIMPDFLHLKPEGYDLWAKAIEDKVCELGGFAKVE